VTGDRVQQRDNLLRFVRTIQKPNVSVDNLGDHEGLSAVGLIDSLAILQIVLYLETTYGIDFSAMGVDPEQLGTIGGILDLIEREAA
jgi:acyl carrier protein